MGATGEDLGVTTKVRSLNFVFVLRLEQITTKTVIPKSENLLRPTQTFIHNRSDQHKRLRMTRDKIRQVTKCSATPVKLGQINRE